MADRRNDAASPPRPRTGRLVLVWGPPSHGPRSRVLARELGMDIRFVHVTDRRGLLVAPYKYVRQALATVRHLVRERPRAVLVQSPPSFAVLVVYLWSLVTGTSFVVDAHSDAMDNPYWTRPEWLYRHVARRASATVVTNQHFADRIRSWGGRALVIRDVPTTFAVGSSWSSDGRFQVVLVNSFGPDEPLRDVLAAAASLPDVRFYVTGSLRRAPRGVLEGVPENVTFTDYLPDDRYYALLSSSDAVMCLTTRDHTMQRGACEALSLGTPIITSRSSLLQEYFHSGTVHVANDAASIAAGVLEVRARPEYYREGIAALRVHQLEEWQEASASLRSLLFEADDRG